MQWIHQFQLFLFDFDGLLVNTEHLQFQAYVNTLAKRGLRLDWSFAEFCSLAHLSATALKEALYTQFPDLDPNWNLLHEEKRAAYLDLLLTGKVELMPGAEALLSVLAEARIRRAVVTNSHLHQIQAIRSQLPILQSISSWVTREDYENPKPNPEPYLRAIQLHSQSGDRIVGFEDTLRGLQALQQTPAFPILVCPADHPLLGMATAGGVLHFETLAAVRL